MVVIDTRGRDTKDLATVNEIANLISQEILDLELGQALEIIWDNETTKFRRVE